MAIERYGLRWHEQMSDLDVELQAFAKGTAKFGGDPDNKPHHFKNIVRYYWGPHSKKHFVWNPWNERMLKYACEHNRLALSGAASTGKSDFGAVWGLVNWRCAPTKTKVLFTSTSLSDSERRIWGRVQEYFMAAVDKKGNSLLPGKLIASRGKIRTLEGSNVLDDQRGIELIAGDRAKEKENIGRLIGLHNERVIFVCDEMPELSPALTEAADSNLAVNPYFQLIAIGNFKGITDPFGMEVEPKQGWGSITEDSEEWETKRGVCLRFDGLKSPNIALGEERFKGIYSARHLKEHRDSLGENSASFWRMCRSYPCPEADANRIYSDADFIKGRCFETVKWATTPIPVASLDPAFATGGDKAIARFGLLGQAVISSDIAGVTHTLHTLQFTERLELREDVRKKDENKSLQVAKQFRDECKKRGIPPKNAAFDGSGGGIVFGALLGEVWSLELLAVQFGGAASQRPASVKDRRPAKEAYANRCTEIWFAGVDFVLSGQIKGLDSYAAQDLTERRKRDPVKGSTGLRNQVETKPEMKQRTNGRSPDDGDASLILLELCRERFGFLAVGMERTRANANNSWKKRAELANRIYANVRYEPEQVAA